MEPVKKIPGAGQKGTGSATLYMTTITGMTTIPCMATIKCMTAITCMTIIRLTAFAYKTTITA